MLIGLLLMLGIAPSAQAMTQPDDVVGVYLYDEGNMNSAGMPEEKQYQKKWKDIKLSPKNTQLIAKYIQNLEKPGFEKYRLAFLSVTLKASGEDVVGAASFYGSGGSVIMRDFISNSGSNVCMLTFQSSGGFAGIHEKPCRRE